MLTRNNVIISNQVDTTNPQRKGYTKERLEKILDN